MRGTLGSRSFIRIHGENPYGAPLADAFVPRDDLRNAQEAATWLATLVATQRGVSMDEFKCYAVD